MSIEKYLVLNKYLLSLFGVSEVKDLLNELNNKSEGVDSDGRSYFVNTLVGIENLKISKDDLLRYDENIQSYVRKINYRRELVSLKYFQYLAVLFTEIFLDNLKNRKFEFLYNLNEFLKKYKQEQEIEIVDDFIESDLKKLAFWMATGSGKTLIMHINYYQFLNYKLFSPDNIILITPNEGLSKQHFEELERSGIPCRLYSGSLGGGLRSNDEVLVIEMTKFVEEKKGRGVTLSIEIFEGKNLVFVDEGHKGKRSEEQKWARRRDELAEQGFVFEYSATFGQILSEKEPQTLKEYAKSIVFDYSYKYFYLDGYGKDFSVLNVKETKISDQEFQEIMFVANFLSFYEQVLAYEENKDLAKEYNLEKPLWIFVGTTVAGKKEESDVIQIVEFIQKVIENEEWVKEWGEKILNGRTNLKNEDNEDVFKDKFHYLKNKSIDSEDLYKEDLYKKVFGGKGSLKLYELKNAEGEIGLKIGENEYFGVINIGEVSSFKKQLEKKGILVEQDAISDSLFDDIKNEDSKINLLIGSKKFIEGWDTWRVSSMGLLNIGKGQGPQIIQLFGRGVRLKGKGMSLKRSEENLQVKLLEMLNIYGIKADYLSKFLEAIKHEEVEFETIKIPVIPQHKDKWGTLYTFSKPKKKYEEEEILPLKIDKTIKFTLDLLPKLSIYQAKERKEEGIKVEEIKSKVEELRFQKDIVDLLNWEYLCQEIFEFKRQKNYWNLIFKKDTFKSILLSDRYSCLSFPEVFEVKHKTDIRRLEKIALLIIKKYMELFYRKKVKNFETENLQYKPVEEQLSIFDINESKYYIVQINKKKKDLIKKVKILTNDLNKLLKEEEEDLPRIIFDNHLYVPIFIHKKFKDEKKNIDKISPPGLVESEKKFVLELREYLKRNKKKFENVEVYLLRNDLFSGVGFQLQWAGFYPDFIMWIKDGRRQTIVFIDPKGLEHTKGLDDEKIQLKSEIKELERKPRKSDIALESFILSKTPYDKLIEGKLKPPSEEEYIENNVLFLDDQNWPEKLFSKLMNKSFNIKLIN